MGLLDNLLKDLRWDYHKSIKKYSYFDEGINFVEYIWPDRSNYLGKLINCCL